MRQLKISKSITSRETRSLEKYFKDVSKYDPLTPDEEAELSRKIKEGDDNALAKLVKANLRFVISVAKQYQYQGLPLADLINEGNLGVIKAAERFDETRGFKFISYAVWWIRQSILQALAENSRIVRLPTNKINTLNKIKTALSGLTQEFEREPTNAEISAIIDESPEEVQKMMSIYERHESIDAPVNKENNDTSLKNLLEDKNIVGPDTKLTKDESLKKDIDEVLKEIPETHREAIKLYYGIGNNRKMSFDEIGKKLGISSERARQVKNLGIRKLKSKALSKKLIPYLA